MAEYGIKHDIDSFHANPTDELEESYEHHEGVVGPPPQAADDDEYLCGHSGPEHSYANAGRDQDRSRADEYVPAQGSARYVN